ncbi:hypothetical protein [Myxococcus fulvus]|uniref:hypothetical protein n=1 Tax=Myxococcus fulvus TaxID=33 RepID=UPI0020BF57AC|nr:hypothetical protein [Myxococcus fulvus]MCK8499896.1 hypothetical protein [Myxococcus fulvus]
MDLPALDTNALQLFVFGPGMGELVAIRAPPNHWLVMDGCSVGGKHYGQQLMDHYGAVPSLIILTHPHLDHAKGVSEVIDAATSDTEPKDWPRIGLVWSAKGIRDDDLTCLTRYYDGAVAKQAISTIFDRWERAPSCRLELRQGEVIPLGEARVKVLAPSPEARTQAFQQGAAGKQFDANCISTVLQVEWEGLRLVLGSDLVENPGQGWTNVLAFDGNAPRHAALKVAHHGSTDAQHPELLRRSSPTDEPFWLITPFAIQSLPRFQPGEGVALLLEHVSRVHLTGIPRSFAKQGLMPRGYRLAELQAPAHGMDRSPSLTGFPDCMVALSWSRSGGPPTVHPGRGSVTVER